MLAQLCAMLLQALKNDEQSHTAFAVTVLCMQQAHGLQACELLAAGFSAFPTKVRRWWE